MSRHIVITGASSGFGWAFAEIFLNDPSWTVHITSRKGAVDNADRLPTDQRARLKQYALDLEDKQSLNTFAEKMNATVPQIDVLINNAGYGLFGALEDLSEEQIRRQMEVNFFGTVLLTQKLLPQIRTAKGHILNLSSAFGFQGFPLTSVYCASKHALEGWSESLYLELAPHGVAVTVLQPGAHRTRFGASVEWGALSGSLPSAFNVQTAAYKRILASKMSAPNPARPEGVAKDVYRIVTRKRGKFRARFGKDAQASHWLRKILPGMLVIKLSDMIMRKIFMRPLEA